ARLPQRHRRGSPHRRGAVPGRGLLPPYRRKGNHPMSPLVHAELMKLRTVWSTWAVLLVLPLVAVISLFDAALDPVEHNTSVADFMDVSLAVVAIAVAAFAAALVGSEFRRRLVGFDYLAVPRRVPVLAAKLIAFAC